MYNQGKTVAEIAEARGFKPATIEQHLMAEWTRDPSSIDYARLNITPDMQEAIKHAVDSVGRDKLKPIKEALPDHVTYLQIKAVMAGYRVG